MRYRKFVILAAVPIMALATVASEGPTPARAFDPTRAPEIQDRLLDGLADFELKPSGELSKSSTALSYTPRADRGCALSLGTNVKVNQNCLNLSDADLQGRGQAQNETSIAADPNNPAHLVSSFNDYRRGDGNCYGAFSQDKAKSWTDTTVPMSFTRGTKYGGARQYWQAGGDTSVAWDTKGNAYLSCQVFMRGRPTSNNPDVSSAFFVFRSTGNDGASWNFPGRPVAESPDPSGSGTAPFLDKQLMTVDNHPGSPFQDRVYVSWTSFDVDGTAYIYEASSKDYGEHFSAPVLVSQTSPLCAYDYSAVGVTPSHGPCDENQFSQPFTGADGALYVAWANFNNAEVRSAASGGADNRNQILLARSTDGGATFSSPVKVGDYYDLPDCATYQAGADFGRSCVPEKAATTHSIFRATNYPSAAVSPDSSSKVVVTYGSYINRYSKEQNGCVPSGLAADGVDLYTGVKTPGACNNKILVSVSTDAGAHFTGAATNPRSMTTAGTPEQAGRDQFWQWSGFSTTGAFATSYYDRQYGDDETRGNSDVTISGSRNLSGFATARVTSSSMPPPTEFSGVFFGDYSGLAVSDKAFPLWMDTRDADLFVCPSVSPPAVCLGTEASGFQAGMQANDQDIFTAGVSIPIPDKEQGTGG